MNKIILSVLIASFTSASLAQVGIHRIENGSGQPNETGIENAATWDQNIYHAPQYMPGHPTAATLWPRVVDVTCKQIVDKVICDGYNWMPAMGRGEYLMIRPVVTELPVPVIVTNTITNTIIKEVVVPIVTKQIKE